MAKTITPEEVARLKREGAEILREKREVSVDGFGALAQAFTRIAEANEAMAAKRNDDVLEAINRLSKTIEENAPRTYDLRPELRELIETQRALLIRDSAPEYRFQIKRNSRHFMTEVIASPASEATH